MSYVEYQDCIKEISINIAFEFYKGMSGNSNVKDISKTLEEISPLNYKDKVDNKPKRMTKNMALAFLGNGKK